VNRREATSRRWHVATVLVVAGSIAGLALARDGPELEPAEPAPSAHALKLHGAQMHPFWTDVSPAEVIRELDALDAAGANAVRVDLSWSSIERECRGCRSSSYVGKVDRFLRRARRLGISVIATLWSTPCWASSAPEDVRQGCDGPWWDRGVTRYPPVKMADYGAIVRWVANRWGRSLAGLEIWNEPNLPQQSFWRTPDAAGDYIRLLRAARAGIRRSGRPRLTVVAGALQRSDGSFLKELYARGLAGRFDALSIHPYSGGASPRARESGDDRMNSFADGVPWIRQIMLAHGDDKPLWLTEFGFTSCLDVHQPICVGPERQAAYTREAWRLLQGWRFVKVATQYNLRDKGTDVHDVEQQFGLLRADFAPKPAYDAFADAMAASR
jgi:hypothetical protein